MDLPSRPSIRLCLLHAVYDKTAWLAERRSTRNRDFRLARDHSCRQSRELRSRTFERACRDEGIALIWREPGEPRYGGHIERLIGTQMGAVHLLPGTTFSSIAGRGDMTPCTRRRSPCENSNGTSALKSRAAIIIDLLGTERRIAVWNEHEGEIPLGCLRIACNFGFRSCPTKNGNWPRRHSPLRPSLLVVGADGGCRAGRGKAVVNTIPEIWPVCLSDALLGTL